MDDRARADAMGGLTFAWAQAENPLAPVRAAQWFNLGASLQAGIPFFVIHDVGLTLAYGQTRQIQLRARTAAIQRAMARGVLKRTAADEESHNAYGRLLSALAKGSLAARMGAGGLSDNVMGALLAKVLEPIAASRTGAPRVELPLSPQIYASVEPAEELTPEAAQSHQEVIKRMAERYQQIILAAEQIDLDTLKLMQMMGSQDTGGDAMEVLDLYQALESPQAHDIVDFCLDLVPQVLETSRSKGAQTFAVGGYASIETKGSLDSLLPTELAYDQELFEQRWSENELLYFGREKDSRERERVHYILVDASAAMRGLRTVFARGLALALCKKLTLRGERVWLRFFDSRLHERMEITSRALRLPHILCFRSERGRNAARVFEDLDHEVGRLTRDEGMEVIITLITHGRLAIPDVLVDRLAQKSAMFGVFVLPSQPVELPYLQKLTKQHIVGAEVLLDPQARTKAALDVLMGA